MWTKLAEAGQSRASEVVAVVTSGTLVAHSVIEELTLTDWSAIMGIIYVGIMILIKLVEGVRFLMKWRENRNGKKKTTKT